MYEFTMAPFGQNGYCKHIYDSDATDFASI